MDDKLELFNLVEGLRYPYELSFRSDEEVTLLTVEESRMVRISLNEEDDPSKPWLKGAGGDWDLFINFIEDTIINQYSEEESEDEKDEL